MDAEEYTGEGATLDEAFENAAKKAAEQRTAKGASPSELAEQFERRPMSAKIQVVAQPHNQWVKAYRVILTG